MRYTNRLIAFFLLLSLTASAQQWRQQPYFYQYKGVRVDSLIQWGANDTTMYPAASHSGAIIFRQQPGDTSYYYSNGVKWGKLGKDPDPDSTRLSTWIPNNDTTTDNTALLNASISWVKSKNRRYLNIDRRIRAYGRLTFDKNQVRLFGSGQIYSGNADNYGETEVGTPNLFTGAVNNSIISFQKSAEKLRDGDTLRIVVFGNSISGGYDMDFMNPDMQDFTIHQVSSSSTWYEYFCRELYKRYSDKKIIIYNRSIPGASIAQYNTPLTGFSGYVRWKTPANQDSTWLGTIRNCKPDLILITHGMNSGVDFTPNYAVVYDSLQLWQKVPEIVNASTPSQNYVNDPVYGDQGDYETRGQRMDVGANQRWISNHYGIYLMDWGRLHDIKRYGTDYATYNYKATKWTAVLSNATATDTSITFSASTMASASVTRSELTRDFSVQFTLRYTTGFNYIDITNSDNSAVRIYTTQIESYPFFYGSTAIGTKTKAYNFQPGTDYRLVINIGHNNTKVFINDTLVIWQKGSINKTGAASIMCHNATGNVLLNNLVFLDAEYTHFLPSLSGNDMWGVDTVWNGNAINHPTILGLNEVYYPVVSEFIQDFARVVDNTNVIRNQADVYPNFSVQPATFSISGGGYSDDRFQIPKHGSNSISNTFALGRQGFGANIQLTGSEGAPNHYEGLSFWRFGEPEPGGGWHEAMRITSSGNVGIDTTLPDARLHVKGGIKANGDVSAVNNGVDVTLTTSSTVGYVGTITNHALALYTNGLERMRVENTGVKIIGTLEVGGVKWITGSGSPEGVVTASAGSIYTNTSGGMGTTLYIKESGTGNTGWIAK